MTAETEAIVRLAGPIGTDALGTGDPTHDYATHLASHAVIEYTLTGKVTRAIAIDQVCPYCGALPPDAA